MNYAEYSEQQNLKFQIRYTLLHGKNINRYFSRP